MSEELQKEYFYRAYKRAYEALLLHEICELKNIECTPENIKLMNKEMLDQLDEKIKTKMLDIEAFLEDELKGD